MEIKDIGIRSLDIPTIPDWMLNHPLHLPQAPPVSLQIGTPIVNIPGCVEAHQSNNKSKTVGVDDDNGLVTYCDAGIPYFRPIEFNADDMQFTGPAEVPKVPPRETPGVPEAIPPAPAAPSTAKIECPTPAQEMREPVGTYIEGFRKKVVEYKLVGNECIQITEKVPLPEQVIAGLPSGGSVVATGSIAVIATASALMAKPLADVLLKVIKPTVKKVMKKIATIRGKKIPPLSAMERRAEQRQRNEAVKLIRSVRPLKK